MSVSTSGSRPKHPRSLDREETTGVMIEDVLELTSLPALGIALLA
jgi:hypothetical protein